MCVWSEARPSECWIESRALQEILYDQEEKKEESPKHPPDTGTKQGDGRGKHSQLPNQTGTKFGRCQSDIDIGF